MYKFAKKTRIKKSKLKMFSSAVLLHFCFTFWNLYCCETNCIETDTVIVRDLLAELSVLFSNFAVHESPGFCVG